jgi:hypothetical protein
VPNAERIAGLVGPSIVAMIVSEFPLVQPHLYDAQIPPVVSVIPVCAICTRTRVEQIPVSDPGSLSGLTQFPRSASLGRVETR